MHGFLQGKTWLLIMWDMGFYAIMFIDVWIALLYPLFFRKKGILISYQSWSVVGTSVTFLVNISPKLLDVATSNFVSE